jgi:molybdopterin-guanine dinucleotide biosynthesis protein B
MLKNARVPLLGIAAWSGTGKTTLLRELLPRLRARGLRVGAIKHAHHSFDIDVPGKDSYELRKAGAAQVLVASRSRWAFVREREADDEPRLDELLLHLDQDALDLVVVEGFKHEPLPKIELHRPSLGRPLLCPDDPTIIAVATDAPLAADLKIPVINLNDPDQICDFILRHLALDKPARSEPRAAI